MPLPLTQESILRVLAQDIHDNEFVLPQSTLSLTPEAMETPRRCFCYMLYMQ